MLTATSLARNGMHIQMIYFASNILQNGSVLKTKTKDLENLLLTNVLNKSAG